MTVYSKAKDHQLLAYKHYEKDGLSTENCSLMPIQKRVCEEFCLLFFFFLKHTGHLKAYPTELLLAFADEAK